MCQITTLTVSTILTSLSVHGQTNGLELSTSELQAPNTKHSTTRPDYYFTPFFEFITSQRLTFLYSFQFYNPFSLAYLNFIFLSLFPYPSIVLLPLSFFPHLLYPLFCTSSHTPYIIHNLFLGFLFVPQEGTLGKSTSRLNCCRTFQS